MDRDLIDRRARRGGRLGRVESVDDDEARIVAVRFQGPGSPASDHERAFALVECMVEAYAQSEAATPPASRSRRDGFQANAARNIRAYLLAAMLELSDAEIAAELGLSGRQHARRARLWGQKLAPRLASAASSR